MKKGILVAVAAFVCCCGMCAEPKRRHATPDGWSDDITAVLATAKAKQKTVLVFFPLHYDEIGVKGRKLSLINQFANPQATKRLGGSFVLAFFPYERPVPEEWREVFDLSKGVTPQLVLLGTDGEFLWRGSVPDFEPDENWGLKWAEETVPELEKVLARVLLARKKAKEMTSETDKAKTMFAAVKGFDRVLVQGLFFEEVTEMVAADKDGSLGIKRHFPFIAYVMPVARLQNDFWNARESKVGEVEYVRRKKRQPLSRTEAARIATADMRAEWEPKIKKMVKATELAEEKLGKVFNEGELKALQSEKKFLRDLLRFWEGETQDVPGYEGYGK